MIDSWEGPMPDVSADRIDSTVARSPSITFVLIACVTAILSLPAVWNRFPLVFSDSASYMAASFGGRWTVDRSGFYGLLFKPILLSVEPLTGLWLSLILQLLIVATVLVLAVRRAVPSMKPQGVLLLIGALAVLTSLWWHSAQWMPDAFAGPLVLLVWMAASRNPSHPGTPFLWLGVVALTLMHYTYLGIAAAALLGTLAAATALKVPLRDIGKRLIAGVIAIGAVTGAHITVNGLVTDRWSVSPLGPFFLFARLNEDGLVPHWLDRHCGHDAPKPLCDMRAELPRDSQVLLWDQARSPLIPLINQRLGEPESWHWVDMLNEAAMGSLREQPWTFAKHAAQATGRQLVHFQAMDEDCPASCKFPALLAYAPSLEKPLYASRQLQDETHKDVIRAVTGTVAILSLLLAIPLAFLAIRRRDPVVLPLMTAIASSLLVNAFMTGALSDVHDRYQSRLIWLVPFVVAVAARRFLPRRQQRTVPGAVATYSVDNLGPGAALSE